MSDVWVWQVIRLGTPPDPPFRILEQGPVPQEQATTEFAKELLQERCDGPSYRVRPGLKLRPEGVRILDAAGNEVLTYSAIDLHRDGGRIATPKKVADAERE